MKYVYKMKVYVGEFRVPYEYEDLQGLFGIGKRKITRKNQQEIMDEVGNALLKAGFKRVECVFLPVVMV